MNLLLINIDGICFLTLGSERTTLLQDLKEGSSCKDNQEYLTMKQKQVLASYHVAWKIGKSMKPFTDGGFVKSCLRDVAEIMCPEQVNKFDAICLSRNTIKTRIQAIAKLIENEIKTQTTKFVKYSVALDETTDINDKAQLAIFIRGVTEDLSVQEYLLDLLLLGTIHVEITFFRHLNKLNCRLQGRYQNVVNMYDQVSSFVTMLDVWKVQLKER